MELPESVVLLDSLGDLHPGNTSPILVCGSHCGGNRDLAGYVKNCHVKAVFLNNAGVGKNQAGIRGLTNYEAENILACAVSHDSAEIGIARDTWENGIISHTGTQAEAILELKLRFLAKLEEMKIRGEQETLAEERDYLETTLNSAQRMKTLIKKEIEEDAKAYGDARRSPIVARDEAQAMTQADLLPVEPLTVILSKKGWIRAAKGHDIDPASLSYKDGDGYLAEAYSRSNQLAVFLDSTGRSYAVAAHTLPSARGQGEPLSGRVNLPSGAWFTSVLSGDPERPILLASDAGYGFVTTLADIFTKNRSGKAVLTLPKNARPLPPVSVPDPETDLLVAITNEGRMLVYALHDLPTLAKGKGNKIINIPAARAKAREELLVALTALPRGDNLIVYAGKRHLKLKPGNLTDFMGKRGQRGRKLPRGFQNVSGLEIEATSQRALL